jgi:four helix bundle protein
MRVDNVHRRGSSFARVPCMTTVPSYTKLVAWRRADDLFIRLHRLASTTFPVEGRYELSAQLRRAGLSVPTNIVEGAARYHRRETLHFPRIAWGSLQEVGYFIHVANRLEYVSEAAAEDLMADVRQVAAPLSGLIASFDGKRSKSYRPRKPKTA